MEVADWPRRWGFAVAVYAGALLSRELLLLVIPTVRYLTLFPALLCAAFLCGVGPTLSLLVGFALTGFYLIDPPGTVPLAVRLTTAVTFLVGGTAVIVPALYAVHVQRLLSERDAQLAFLNQELNGGVASSSYDRKTSWL